MGRESKFRRELHQQGWVVEKLRKHFKITHPEIRGMVIHASTPSDHRAEANTKARLKRLRKKL